MTRPALRQPDDLPGRGHQLGCPDDGGQGGNRAEALPSLPAGQGKAGRGEVFGEVWGWGEVVQNLKDVS